MTPIRAVLFDADGVLQRRQPGLVRRLLRLGGPRFTIDCFRAEVSCLNGERDLLTEFGTVIARHRVPALPEAVAAGWLQIVPDPDAFALVSQLREAGVVVAIGTNQNRYRGEFMRHQLGYDQLFDANFYSYVLGVAKPEGRFFERVASDLGLEPREVLFLDDQPANVRGARRTGMAASWHPLTAGAARLARVLHRRGLLQRNR